MLSNLHIYSCHPIPKIELNRIFLDLFHTDGDHNVSFYGFKKRVYY